jgi:hypothetical protein
VPLARFIDPGGAEASTDYSADIFWGDDDQSPGFITFDPSDGSFSVNLGVHTNHRYLEEGAYNISVILHHEGAQTLIGGIPVTVADAAVVPHLGRSIQAVEGTSTGRVDFASFLDPGGLFDLTDYSVSIDWGDNTQSDGLIVPLDATRFDVASGHQFSEEGNYSISITVDHGGTQSTLSGIPAIVEDALLTGTPAQISATAGAPFSGVVGSFSDADPDGTLSDYSATILWGDGNASVGMITANGNGGFIVSGTYTYAAAGAYHVTVQVHDAGGSEADVLSSAGVTALGQFVQPGLAGDTGFWHNKRGQALINSFDGGSAATALSNWLAVMFPNLYGVGAGAYNLTGMSNSQVAAFFQTLFSLRGPRFDAEVLAIALDVYSTTESLGGSAASAYGFHVTNHGLGAYSYNVGPSGGAFGVANNTVLNVYQILKAVNRQAVNGILYNGDRTLDLLALPVFEGIATAGSI